MSYLILRCHPRDTLTLPPLHPSLNLLCPTTTFRARKGPSRSRTMVTVPILPSFLFLPIDSAKELWRLPSKLHYMKRPHEAPLYPNLFDSQNPLPDEIPRTPPTVHATCTLDEISVMVSTAGSIFQSKEIQVGSRMEVTAGLICGVKGIVAQIRTNGDITLKIQQHLGWQFSTCIVNASVLRLL